MKLEEMIAKLSAPLAHPQMREVKGRLKFAGIDIEDVQSSEEEVVREVVATVVKAGAQERRASFSGAGAGCPRCGNGVESIRLADSGDAQYCKACRVVIPG